ncbi:MAG: xanthine dehydrogenase family protein molybdopterin-binding subunit [Piscinibacter sp.]|uniref:xanthine dehydrogenase family protein molybdopterin-binding subunit n=1 Tax=Piscinibacter sp. TaxID=1903157 RepID=UPI001B3D716F|nr:xanthine dehydrogenase family protein molybdopterin-binding subunit [Piscinibacter sp.]MBP5989118.1 xanthine dehydrogenase family protein molybdopterin-binding subunit [Piscinibacter sp.]MBP6026162.1 xanthine dehydrogenase family protein molybdopterin-binding subunit [Piscinibacter sp.]
MDATLTTSRRGFLKSGAGAALTIGFALPTTGWSARLEAATPAVFAPNAWLRLTGDGTVTVLCGSAEMGQGVLTAIPMLLAEELDANWKRVRVQQAPVDQAYNNPMFGMQATGGSTTVRAHWEPLRKAGAAAREMLVAAAAAQWKVPASECHTEAGQVIHQSGKKLAYGALVPAAMKLAVPAEPTLKDPKDFRILGKRTRRLDTPAKLDGSAKYGIDAQLPGLLVAVMARAPQPGAKPAKVDDSKAKAVKGVQQIITIPHGVAVLAEGYWAAKKGRDALAIDWDLGAAKDLSTAKVSDMLATGASQADAIALDAGNVKDAAANSASTLDASYEAPYLAHACMEPMNCTAWVRGDTVEIWAGTQSQGPNQGILSQVASVTPAKVKINTMLLGGGFGRRFAPDFTIDATLLSKISGKPVKLIYSREDDMAAGFYRPASVAKFEAALDAKGQPTMLKCGVGSPSIMAASGFMKIPENGVDSFAMEGIADHPYDIANQRLAYGRTEPGPQVWFWRSVGHSQNIFFIESFIDELAAAAKADPFEYRRALLTKQPRYKGVLELAAQKAGWGSALPKGQFRGIAVAQSFGSYVAEVAEVSVAADGTPRVHRVVAAVDCGMTVNPQTIERQIEGAIVYGLSAALYGRIGFKDGRVEQGNFNDYPVLRMNEMPKVEVHIVQSSEKPGGIGEPGTPPIAPAVANAIFAATGKRLRHLPFDTAQLKTS